MSRIIGVALGHAINVIGILITLPFTLIYGVFSGLSNSTDANGRSKNNQIVSSIDAALINKLALLESELRNNGDFYGFLLDREREEILSHPESSIANVILGLIYLHGINVSIDIKLSEIFFHKSIRLGCPFAYKYLAVIEITEKANKEKGLKYMLDGVKTGDEEAMLITGAYYAITEEYLDIRAGESPDMKKAVYYWEMAANLGHSGAEQNLVIARSQGY